ncbi:hypothetical protein C5B90_13175 [Haloferax sp. Atlit-12N]|nr:hypothetical protein C5B90_13175 [Haloferax sp. Atlit-12N]
MGGYRHIKFFVTNSEIRRYCVQRRFEFFFCRLLSLLLFFELLSLVFEESLLRLDILLDALFLLFKRINFIF